jgi:hypothetical protein
VNTLDDEMSTSSVPALLRQQVDRWAETWLRTRFSRLLELRAQDPGSFNYPIAVFSEWRGKAFYLNVGTARGVAGQKMTSSFATRG